MELSNEIEYGQQTVDLRDWDMVVHICNPRIQGVRQEDHTFEAILGYILRPCIRKKKVEVCLSWSGAPPFCWPRGVGEPQVQLRSRVHGPGAGDPFLPPIPPPQCSPPPSPCRRVAMSSPVSTPPPERLGEYRDCLIPARRGSYYGSPSVPGPSLRDRRQATLVQ